VARLSDEQRAALQQSPDGISCEDVVSRRPYVVVEEKIYRRAMQALKKQQDLKLSDAAAPRSKRAVACLLRRLAFQQAKHEMPS